MKDIRRKLSLLALNFLGILLLGFSSLALDFKNLSMFFLGLALALLILFFKNLKLQADVNLILDNAIFQKSLLRTQGGQGEKKQMLHQIVFSTFGLLLGDRVYKWGKSGKSYNKLKCVAIDDAFIKIQFTQGGEDLEMEIFHGFKDPKKIEQLSHQVFQETGIRVLLDQ